MLPLKESNDCKAWPLAGRARHGCQQQSAKRRGQTHSATKARCFSTKTNCQSTGDQLSHLVPPGKLPGDCSSWYGVAYEDHAALCAAFAGWDKCEGKDRTGGSSPCGSAWATLRRRFSPPPNVAGKPHGAGGQQGQRGGLGRDVQHQVLVGAATLNGQRCRQAADRAAGARPQAAADALGLDQDIRARAEPRLGREVQIVKTLSVQCQCAAGHQDLTAAVDAREVEREPAP